MVIIPVSIKSWAHNLKIVDDICRELRRICRLGWGLTVSGRFRQEETVEPTFTCWNYVADFHLFTNWRQVEPYLLSLAVKIHVWIDLLIELNIFLLHLFWIAFIDNLAIAYVIFDTLESTKNHDVIFLDCESKNIAKFLWQSDLEEAP